MSRSSRRAARTWIAAALLSACAAPPTEPEPQPEPGPGAFPTEAIVRPQPAPGDSRMMPLANGLACYVQSGPLGSSAQIQFGVFAGSLFVTPGLADLAAHTLLHSTDPTTGTPSLQQRIRALGGSIDVRVGLMTTWFDIRLLPGRTPAALKALREALETVTRSRTQITRMRDERLAEYTAETLEDPVAAAARRLLQARPGTATHVNDLLDIDPSEVTLFHSRLYRPERCILTVRTPQRLPMAISGITAGQKAISGWAPPPSVPGESPVNGRQFASGLYWSEVQTSGGKAKCAIVMQLPDPIAGGAAEWLVMHSVLTLDGSGGRIEQLQDEAGLSHLQWQSRFEQTPDVSALVMTTTATPAEVEKLWNLYQRARQSLLAVPPSRSELQLALRRAQLNASQPAMSSADDLRLDVNLKMRNVRRDALARRLAILADTAAWDSQEAARAYLETPAWMVAVGPSRPDDLEGVIATDILPDGFDPRTQNQPTAENLAAVVPWMARARAATGGDETYRKLKGFTAKAQQTSEQGLTASDALDWGIDGSFSRTRTITGQQISTTLTATGGSEEMDGVRKSLTPREVRLLRHGQMRHPQMLLAAHLRSELRFRPVAQRQSGDRELYIVEAVGEEFDRLRVHIDAQSQLIRVVESWERLADDTLVHVQEEWSDYRNTGGMRVPHRRRTTWNDGQHQSETVFSDWRPK